MTTIPANFIQFSYVSLAAIVLILTVCVMR
ncbi:hypothetical protein FHS21_002577 [Phyllobacterium trifolii]|uniref:Uncharacterized protein n=1 Tax=Phyllobacterium trifolii TaxID=300193 RepID=A0A839UB55_9HYPH|nr:hypothetical protein [Phyllobacterium trifolii]